MEESKIVTRDDIEKNVFLKVLSEEISKSKNSRLNNEIERKAQNIAAFLFLSSSKGTLLDTKDLKRKLKEVIEKD